jgi:hypothetical protein
VDALRLYVELALVLLEDDLDIASSFKPDAVHGSSGLNPQKKALSVLQTLEL